MKLSMLQEAVLREVQKDDYSKALILISDLPEDQKRHPRMIMAKADSLYENGDDLGALSEYIKLVRFYPNGSGANFAKIGIVVCLKNLDMQEEAYEILKSVDDGHDGKLKELKHSEMVIDRQGKARRLLEEMNK